MAPKIGGTDASERISVSPMALRTPFSSIVRRRHRPRHINRPDKLNALNATVIARARRCGRARSRRTPAIRAVILTGAGPKAFVAGADISELSDAGTDGRQGARARGPAGLPRASSAGQAGHRRGQRVRPRRRLRAGDGVPPPDRQRERQVRPARGEARASLPGYGGTVRLPRHRGQGPRARAAADRGHDRCGRGAAASGW